MFGSDQPTPYDLKFRLAGIPVRVSPWFWIIMALLGSSIFNREGPLFLVLFVACGFVSILVHEMGHAVAARFYGSPVAITLIAFGGYAQYSNPPRSAFKRILISLAGPGAGFGLLGLVVAVTLATDGQIQNDYAEAGLRYLFFMNLVWNLFNLLPIWPLDGGKVCRELFAIVRLRNPDSAIHRVSLVLAGSRAAIGVLAFLKIGVPANGIPGLGLVIAYLSSSPMMTIWMGMFAFENYQMLQVTQHRGYYYEDDDTPPWRRN